MGVADLRKAFDRACGGKARCHAARMYYEHNLMFNGQRLEFDVITVADNKSHLVRSELIPPTGGPLIEEAKKTAATFLAGLGQS